MSRAVFLDRDGVINEIALFPELGLLDCPLNPDQFRLLPNVSKAIKILHSLNFKVIVVSNQPAMAKGKMTMNLFNQVRAKMGRQLLKGGAYVDGEYYCFHHPKAKRVEFRVICDCRKPKPGLILRAAKDFDLELSKCYMIGDSLTDVKAGKRVGCKSFLIGRLKCDLCSLMSQMGVKPDLIISNLYEAAKVIRKEVNEGVKPDLILSSMYETATVIEKEVTEDGGNIS